MKRVFAGSAGIVVDSGTSPATSTPTGRAAFGLTEYTVQVTGLSVTLTPGSYWMTVVPVCTNSADPYCDGVFFASDVEYLNTTPANAYGPAEPVDASFFDSPSFGLCFDPTNGSAGRLRRVRLRRVLGRRAWKKSEESNVVRDKIDLQLIEIRPLGV